MFQNYHRKFIDVKNLHGSKALLLNEYKSTSSESATANVLSCRPLWNCSGRYYHPFLLSLQFLRVCII